MSKTSKTVAVLVLVLSLGLHWAALQSVAWVSMIVRYAQDYPLHQAISMTFDGQHPCTICHIVSQALQAEGQQDQPLPPPLPLQKIESVAFEPAAILFPPTVMGLRERPQALPLARSDAPPAPPPRCV